MIRYFDASAWVKRYVREAGTDQLNRLVSGATVATCRLTEAEVSSALCRRAREGDLSESGRDAALALFRADLHRIRVVELVPAVVASVHVLLSRHPLRASDALQLAAALALRHGVADLAEVDFVGCDDRLNRAAAAEGFLVHDPTGARTESRR